MHPSKFCCKDTHNLYDLERFPGFPGFCGFRGNDATGRCSDPPFHARRGPRWRELKQTPSNYTLYRMDPQKNILNNVFCTTISNIWKRHGPASIWEQQKHRIVTKWISCRRYRQSSSRKLRRVIYYTLYRMDPKKHTVPNGSSKHILCFVCTTISNIWKLHGPASIWEQQKNVKLWQH